MDSTLLEYLQSPNPQIISCCRSGPLSNNPSWTEVTGLQPWDDFTYETLLSCYGEVLRTARHPGLLQPISPNLTDLEREIWDEDSLRIFLGRSILPLVTNALGVAFHDLHPQVEDPPEIRAGGFAKGHETDSRLYPDWAGIRYTQHDADNLYINLCPGETKVAAKWKSSIQGDSTWNQPWKQAQTYAAVLCDTRYGYVLTDEELVVFRIRIQKVDEGLAKHRGRRVGQTSTHNRRISGMSQLSSLSSSMSQMSISDYMDDKPDIEFEPIQYRSIPWAHSGEKLTIKLALFWLHMLASAPFTSKSIENGYPPLDSWEEKMDGYVHTTTGLQRKHLSRAATILDNPIDPSGEIDDGTIYVEDIVEIDQDKRNGWILTVNDGRRIVTKETPRLRKKRDNKWYFLKKTGIDTVEWKRDKETH